MSMKDAKASNWVAEIATPTASGFSLKGSSKGYTSFSRAFSANQQVFYSAHDENGSREAGYATFDGTNLVDRKPTATLSGGVYSASSPSKMNFSGDVTVACTFNALAFNTLWSAFDQIDPDGDGSINIPPELINGLGDALAGKANQVDLDAEIAARIAGDADLQAQIDAIDPDGDLKVEWDEIGSKPTEFPPAPHNHDGEYLKDETDPTVPDHVKAITQDDIDGWNAGGGGASTWDELTGKPTEFPPESHTHEIDDVNGLQDALDAAGGTPAWDDVTGKPTEFPPEDHTHDQYALSTDLDTEIQARIDGDAALDLRIDAVEDSITSGGGFVEAPNDGKLYGRQSENWAEVVIPSTEWDDITGKPTEFPPVAHTHDYLSDAPDDSKLYGRQSGAWAEVVIPSTAWDDITSKPTEFPPEAHVHTIANVTGLQDALDGKAAAVHTHNYLSDAPDDGAQYARQSVDSKMVWSVVSGGSLVVVDDEAPENPATGQLWFDTDNGTLNLFDGNDWINIATGSKTIYTLPVAARSGVVQLPVSDDADNLPVSLRSGSVNLPLNERGDILAVMTRGGELELPLAA